MSAIANNTFTWIPCAHTYRYRLREAVQRYGIGKWNHILDDPEYSIVVRKLTFSAFCGRFGPVCWPP
jgi:hypothetical protein